jgi:hypothetical protein
VIYNKHRDLKSYYQAQLLLFHPFITSKESQLGKHKSWHDAYFACESLINHVRSKFILNSKSGCKGYKIGMTLNYVHTN